MGIEDLNKAKVPLVKINKKLEKFRGKILFPEKLEAANKLLLSAKLPEKNQYQFSLIACLRRSKRWYFIFYCWWQFLTRSLVQFFIGPVPFAIARVERRVRGYYFKRVESCAAYGYLLFIEKKQFKYVLNILEEGANYNHKY